MLSRRGGPKAPPSDEAARTTTTGARWHAPSASATPWDGIEPGALAPAQRLVMDVHREAYERLHEPDRGGDARFLDGYARDRCPRCGSKLIAKCGHDRQGLRRWRCNSCCRDFSPVTGTAFEDHRLPASDRAGFLPGLFSHGSVREIVRQERRSPTTPPYWLAKVFAVPGGVQCGVVPGGGLDARIDETYYPIPLAEAGRNADGSLRRGLPGNRICIAVACEARARGGAARSTYEVCGRVWPSGPRAVAAYGPHIAEGARVVHDKERARGPPVRKLGLESEAYDSREISRLPDEENPLREADRLRFLPEAFPGRHNGFDRDRLADWLNLFHVIMNPPDGKLEKAALVRTAPWPPPKRSGTGTTIGKLAGRGHGFQVTVNTVQERIFFGNESMILLFGVGCGYDFTDIVPPRKQSQTEINS